MSLEDILGFSSFSTVVPWYGENGRGLAKLFYIYFFVKKGTVVGGYKPIDKDLSVLEGSILI
jgi:hypothetical protein